MSAFELTVLGSSGSYGAQRGGACSGYLVRAGGASIWMDCGNGTLVNLERHADIAHIDAVVITHAHPDHCADIYGLHVLNRYGLERCGLPVYAPEGVEATLGALVHDWGDTFDWRTVGDGDSAKEAEAQLRFLCTDHPLPTVAVEIAASDHRLVYTSDTGPGWSAEAFGRGADLLLSEATYIHRDIRAPIHLSAHQAGLAAREAAAKRLVLTHIWPTVDSAESQVEAAEAFGATVDLATPHQTFVIGS